jgi:predicted dehydrogenase
MRAMTPLRAAVIGVGYFGSRHADKLARLPGVKLEYVVDADPARAAAVAANSGARATSNFRDVLGAVDVATVAVPTQTHAEVAEALLSAGIHVLIEKPLTATLAEADRVVAAAVKHGVVLRVGHLERFNPALVAVRDRIAGPRYIECERLAPFKPRGTDVDVLLDLMIHDLDIVLSLVDSPVAEVRALGVPVLTPSIDIANARIAFENGCVANIDASRMSVKPSRKLRLFQPDCYMSLDLQERSVDIVRADPGATGGPIPGFALERTTYPEGDSLETELAAFVDAVRGRDRPAATGEDARRALELALVISHRILDAAAAGGR